MKLLFITFLILVTTPAVLFAQDVMPVKDVSREISTGMQPGFLITIDKANFKTVQRNWEKNIKNSKLSNVLKKQDEKVIFNHVGDEYIAENLIVPSISAAPINIIATIADIMEGIRVVAFFEIDSVFVTKENSKEETYLAAKNYLRSFGIEELTNVVNGEIDAQEDLLNDMENDLSRLRSKKEDYEKSIDKNKSNIRDMEASIKANLIDQERQIKKVNIAKDTLYTFERKTDEYKFFKGKLKDEEKFLKKYERSNKGYHSKIKKYELNIDSYKEKISSNLNEQKAQKEKIKKQKKTIEATQQRLQKIR